MHKTILLFSGIFATILLREMSRQSAQASSYRFDIQLCCCALPSILFVQCIDFYYIRQWVGHFECQTNWVTYFALGFFIRRFYLLCCKKGRCLTIDNFLWTWTLDIKQYQQKIVPSLLCYSGYYIAHTNITYAYGKDRQKKLEYFPVFNDFWLVVLNIRTSHFNWQMIYWQLSVNQSILFRGHK